MTKIRPLMSSVQAAGAAEKDAIAYVAFLDAQPQVDKTKKIGTQGYCMGGALVVRTAASVPERIGAGASFHGGGLVTDKPDSPHLLAPKIKARMYFGVAANDDQRQPDAKDKLKESFHEGRRSGGSRGLSGKARLVRARHADRGWRADLRQGAGRARVEQARRVVQDAGVNVLVRARPGARRSRCRPARPGCRSASATGPSRARPPRRRWRSSPRPSRWPGRRPPRSCRTPRRSGSTRDRRRCRSGPRTAPAARRRAPSSSWRRAPGSCSCSRC